ncbi:hypothetical protein OKA04_12735 [Luteolibacter flavescens]|uniref:Uncharacterized protein n=1 Tax=Luteolibacter flavescens TaxID=1859460 RepID=A0ABT3FPU6_9BACT|nr:hypothetical protein [Luteolibacter flavescens]MCW1885597.1 hypothetical protein [Luteolibacter flavescens]
MNPDISTTPALESAIASLPGWSVCITTRNWFHDGSGRTASYEAYACQKGGASVSSHGKATPEEAVKDLVAQAKSYDPVEDLKRRAMALGMSVAPLNPTNPHP